MTARQLDLLTGRDRSARGPVPTELDECKTFWSWVLLMERQRPELGLILHVPNGGHRYAATAAAMKRTGVRPGVPDYLWPHARGNYLGMAIEMKRARGVGPSIDQQRWMGCLTDQGWNAVVARGAQQAIEAVEAYLALTAAGLKCHSR